MMCLLSCHYYGVKTTWGVDSQFARCRIHTGPAAYPLRRQSYASTARPGVAGRAAPADAGATPQSEGLVRARSRARFHTPAPWGRSLSINPVREGCPAPLGARCIGSPIRVPGLGSSAKYAAPGYAAQSGTRPSWTPAFGWPASWRARPATRGRRGRRCWNHKMRNVLDRLPQREQSEAKDLLRAVVYAPSRAEAVKARAVLARRYRPWYPKAVDVLEDDWERMVAFYDFPEDHWKHLRTTNVVERAPLPQ